MRFWREPRTSGTRRPSRSTDGTTGAAPAVPVRRARGQAGLSLIESLISVVLVSLVVLGLAGGFLTMMRATEASSSRQRTDAAITSFTESLKSVPYTPCVTGRTGPQDAAAYQSFYETWDGRWTPPADAAVSDRRITGVEYWSPANVGGSAGDYVASCPGADAGAQRLTVSVTVNGSTATGQVVIRSAP